MNRYSVIINPCRFLVCSPRSNEYEQYIVSSNVLSSHSRTRTYEWCSNMCQGRQEGYAICKLHRNRNRSTSRAFGSSQNANYIYEWEISETIFSKPLQTKCASLTILSFFSHISSVITTLLISSDMLWYKVHTLMDGVITGTALHWMCWWHGNN